MSISCDGDSSVSTTCTGSIMVSGGGAVFLSGCGGGSRGAECQRTKRSRPGEEEINKILHLFPLIRRKSIQFVL